MIMPTKRKILIIVGVVLGLSWLVASLPARQLQEAPELTVIISPSIPTSYEETTITIQVESEVPLGGGPEIFDETRQIGRVILWSHPVTFWEGTRTLPQLFGPEGDNQLNQITVRVTLRDQQGREKIIRKVIQFEP